MKKMTARERMMTALRHGVPDRVPVAPDFSCMIPCRLTGKPYWDVLLYNDPPLWRAYLDAVRHFGTDGWFMYGHIQFHHPTVTETRTDILSNTGDRMTVRHVHRTPDGELAETIVFPRNDASAVVERMIKDFREDFPKIRHLFQTLTGYDRKHLDVQIRELGELGMMGVSIGTPGLHTLFTYFNGNLEAAIYAMEDEPDLFGELCGMYERLVLQQTEFAIDCGVDSILTGGSGSITMQSPDLWRQLSLPTIRKQTKMCREAGIISGIHSCGKEKEMVRVCAEETDLDYINPLEVPPMGDCDLAECRRLAGDRLSLMGNLHTTDVMLFGTTDDVRRESLKAMLAAGVDGGFVLSTGDQCGRDTPYENIFELVRTVEEFGYYPLNIDRIRTEIERLDRKQVAKQAGNGGFTR